MAEMTKRRVFGGKRFILISLIAGVAGLALWAVGLAVAPRQAMMSYLAAFTFVTSLVLGVLLLLMIGNVMSARWLVALRRVEEAVVATLPALAVLFVPIAVGAGDIYAWISPPPTLSEHDLHVIEHKHPYLNLTFFLVRTVIYFVVWIVVAELLRAWSLRRGVAPESPQLWREKALSAGMLPLVGLCLTFAAFDWLMSLQPTWFSSMFGVYYFAGGFGGGIALLIVLAQALARTGPLREAISRYHFHALGRLLLGFVLFWAYIAFFQAMLIQLANKPEEVTFYVDRAAGGWMTVVYLLIIGRFALPFLVLLPRRIKLKPPVLTGVAAWLLLMHYIDIYWLVLPVARPEQPLPSWLDIVTLAGVVGAVAAVAGWRQRGLSLLAEGDPRLDEGLSYRSVP